MVSVAKKAGTIIQVIGSTFDVEFEEGHLPEIYNALDITAKTEGGVEINLVGDVALYGRNWGCIEDHPFLHFEVCYYQAIEFAIARGLKRVEAGAQGEHKLARGYRPVLMHSAHDIADPGLRRAVADYLRRERAHVDALVGECETLTPFKRACRAETP